jgi:hypothetical protein
MVSPCSQSDRGIIMPRSRVRVPLSPPKSICARNRHDRRIRGHLRDEILAKLAHRLAQESLCPAQFDQKKAAPARSGKSREDPPTNTVYSPNAHSHASFCSLNVAMARGSRATVMTFLWPEFSGTRCQAASRRKCSLLALGSSMASIAHVSALVARKNRRLSGVTPARA